MSDSYQPHHLTSPESDSNSLTIVGIGASAGGLAALKTFFAHVPEDSGLAYVIVVHLAPDQESHLADLLQAYVNMPVRQVTETMPVEANCVYVIPPGNNLDTIDTHLRLSELEERRRDRAPIDHFFRTLASVHDGNSVAVILTGTGSDGTLGIKEIKGQGGLTVVQDPNEAEYDGMPQSAIATGLIDLVLPLAEIPQNIIRFARTEPQVAIPKEDEEALHKEEQQLLQKIFTQLRARTGRDFSRYKRSTIMRRLRRRMQLAYIEKIEDYLHFLRQHSEEVVALSNDFLITVTNFFRDAAVFEQLKEEVIPHLFENKRPDQSVRVWTVGCSTGEEAYSLAMLLLEEAAQYEAPPEIQLFASDLHESSLHQAREGFYSGDIKGDISPERLRRFFIKEDSGYRIRKEVRDLVVFAPHNLLSDPPFSKLDLISCRNLMIYLQREVQHDVIALFHYALCPKGFLLLGTSETIEGSDLFRTEHKGHCLYQKRNVPAPEPKLAVFPRAQTRQFGYSEQEEHDGKPVAYGALHQQIVEHYAPPSLLMSPDYKVVHLSEHVGRYLVHPGGEITSNVFKLVQPDFHIELRAALHLVKEKGTVAHSKPIPIQLEGALQQVTLSVYPAGRSQQEFFLVIFDDQEPLLRQPSLRQPSLRISPRQGVHRGRSADLPDWQEAEFEEAENANATEQDQDASVQELETELDLSRQRLQAVIEEYETSQEEMKASNEEMQSTNEELRSTMEELETSKEELQSMNEELSTLNQENRHKVEELSQLSGDLQNLLAATDIATLFLDRKLRILRFTPRASELFNVRHLDRGRPLSDLTHRLGYDDLQDDAQQVLARLVPVEREVQDEAGRWYLTRVLPYRSADDRIEGVVITFVDITSRRQSEEALRENEEQYRALVEASAQMVWTTNADGKVAEDSPSWRAFTGQTYAEWEGDGWLNAVHPDDRPHAEANWLQAVRAGNPIETTFRLHHTSGAWRWMVMRAVPLRNPDGSVRGWVGMNADVTERREAEEALRRSEEHLQLIMQSAIDYAIFTLGMDRKITDWNVGAERILGYKKEEILGRLGDILFTEEDRKTEPEQEMQKAKEKGHAENERWHVRKDGSRFWGSGYTVPLRQESGEVRGFLKIMLDNTKRMQMEEALRQAKEEAERAAHAKEEFLAHMSHEIRTPLNAVVGLADLLLRHNSQPRQLENLQTLKFSAENLKMLVNDILDFSKIQAGKVMVEERDVHLKELLNSLQKAHQAPAAEQGNELRFQVDEQLPEIVRTDPLKLSQVMNNLLSNAVKFTKHGTVIVEVSLSRQKEDPPQMRQLWVTFSVRDTGIGIPSDKLATIFDTFTQADISTVREYGGTGLGLSITKLLLELMDSQIEVESEQGKGTRFFFTLPMRMGSPLVSPTQELASPPTEPTELGNLRVLLVEDVAVNRMMLNQFLQEWWRFTPDEANNGQQAVDMARQTQYDLILMDVRMPVMDGYQAAQAIRALERYQRVPILALTADTMQEVEKHPEAACFTDVVTKPFDPADLQQKIRHHATHIPEQANASSGTSSNGQRDAAQRGAAQRIVSTTDAAQRSNIQEDQSFNKATPSSISSLDLQKVEEVFDGNTELVEQFLEKAVAELTVLREAFPQAVAERNEASLDDLVHKATVLLDTLALPDVAILLERARSLVQEEAAEEKLQEVQRQGEERLKRVITLIQQELS